MNSTEVACGLRASALKSPPHLQAVLRLGRFTDDYCSSGEQLLVWGANDYSFHIRTNSRSDMKPLLIRGQTTIAVALTFYRFAHALW